MKRDPISEHSEPGSESPYLEAISSKQRSVDSAARASQECPERHQVERANRPKQSLFRCVKCGFSDHADHVAAVNVRLRALVNKPMAVYGEVKAKIGTATEYNCKPMTSSHG